MYLLHRVTCQVFAEGFIRSLKIRRKSSCMPNLRHVHGVARWSTCKERPQWRRLDTADQRRKRHHGGAISRQPAPPCGGRSLPPPPPAHTMQLIKRYFVGRRRRQVTRTRWPTAVARFAAESGLARAAAMHQQDTDQAARRPKAAAAYSNQRAGRNDVRLQALARRLVPFPPPCCRQ